MKIFLCLIVEILGLWWNFYFVRVNEKVLLRWILEKKTSNRQWNSIQQEQKNLVVKLALDYPDLSSRELAYKIIDEQLF